MFQYTGVMSNLSFDKVRELQLVQGLIQGDIDAFDTLYYRYHRGVFANILKLVQQQDMAEDILQDVFVALWENREKLEAGQPVAGWLFTVSRNKSLKLLKKILKEKIYIKAETAVQGHPEEDNKALAEIKLVLAESAINKLPARKKQVFRLCVLEGKSYNEAAKILGISDLTVKEYVKYSYKFIKEQVADSKTVLSILCLYILAVRN